MIGAFMIMGAALICVGLWFAYCAIIDAVPNRWADFQERTPIRDQQYRDRIASGAQSFRDALALSDNQCSEYVGQGRDPIREVITNNGGSEYAANNDKPIGQFVEWPVITEEQVVKLHGGEQS